MRTGVTIQDVTRAADQLLTAGERPTVEAVRALLGTGAPATVNRLLKDYYQALGGRLTLPPEIAGAAAGLVEKIRVKAAAEAEAREADAHAQLERDRAQLAAERAAFEQERMQLRDRLVALGTDLERLQDSRAGLERRVTELEQALVEQTRRTAAAEASAAAAGAERQRAEEKHRTVLQDLQARMDGNERHFLAQIEQGRDQLKRVQAEKDKEGAAATKRIGELETRLAEASQELSGRRTELARCQADLDGARTAHGQLESRLATEIKRYEQQIARLGGERDALQGDLHRERERNNELQRGHEQAVREAALHQGRALALQGQLEDLRGRAGGKGRRSAGTENGT